VDRPDNVLAAEPKRPNFFAEYRRAIVEITLTPGASTSRIARENGLNVNMVFKWRQRYLKELASKAAASDSTVLDEPMSLLPVSVIDVPSPPTKEPAPTTTSSCEVEVEVGKRRVRIRGVSLEFAEKFLRDCLKCPTEHANLDRSGCDRHALRL